MGELQKLPNIGAVAEDLLIRGGIDTPEKLRLMGSKEAFLRIRLIDPTVCIHMLYGIEGAVEGILDMDLSGDIKNDLKAFYRSLKQRQFSDLRVRKIRSPAHLRMHGFLSENAAVKDTAMQPS